MDISNKIMLKKLTALKGNKHPGPDNPHPRVLKVEVLGALDIIVQTAVDHVMVPADQGAVKITLCIRI